MVLAPIKALSAFPAAGGEPRLWREDPLTFRSRDLNVKGLNAVCASADALLRQGFEGLFSEALAKEDVNIWHARGVFHFVKLKSRKWLSQRL